MATVYWRNASYTEVAQVVDFTITAASTSNTAVWTLTITLDDGSTATVTYTEDGSPTTTEIAAGLTAAWNASNNPDIARITASDPSAGVCRLTADTAGRPFSVALADDDDGTHTQTTVTANKGVNDWGTASNWSGDAVPVNDDDVIIPGAASGNAVAILYGLNQSSVTLDDVYVQKDYNANIGRIENGVYYYLRIDPDTFDYRASSALAIIDIGAANISPYIEANGTAGTNKHALYLKGSNIATLEIRKGSVGIAALPGETATVATLLCSYLTNATSDVTLVVGAGVTLTTLTQSGGTCTLNCAATTVTNAAGTTLTTDGTGAITTLNVYGTTYANSTGTVGTTNLYGTLDTSKDRSSRTFTTINAKVGGVLKRISSGITLTTLNMPTDPGSFTYTLVG